LANKSKAQSVKPASVSNEFEISICLGHSQGYIYNAIYYLPLESIAQR
jgi:hypothetical protein